MSSRENPSGTMLSFLNNPPFPLSSIDRELLVMQDEAFSRITWQELQEIIAQQRLEDLKRLPSDLRRYLQWSYETKLRYGTITNFVVQERLHWTPNHAVTIENPVTASSFDHYCNVPYQDDRDYAILKNDWPYGFEDGITHIVVWSRTPVEVDSDRGDMTPRSRQVIESFVQKTFVEELAQREGISTIISSSRILWFKNWVSLQSVRGVDHIHVLVRDIPDDLLLQWTMRS